MILTAITMLLFQAQGQAKPPVQTPPQTGIELPSASAPAKPIDVGTQEQATLTITRHVDARYDPNKTPVNGSWAGGMQQQDIQVGQMSFSVADAMFQGKPVKQFRGQSKWSFKPKVRNKQISFTPTLFVFAQIGLDGRLIHTNTTYAGFGTPVQIDAFYNKDSIDMTMTEGTRTKQTTLYPTMDMSLFNNLFQPFVNDGLVANKERQLAFLNPVTGAPVQVTATLTGHFQGKLYFREYEGYKIDTTTPGSRLVIQSMVTRQGQLMQVNLPDHQDALAYSTLSHEEENSWGLFKQSDWDKPSSVAQPQRRRYKTMALPVLLVDPTNLLYPVPCCVAL